MLNSKCPGFYECLILHYKISFCCRISLSESIFPLLVFDFGMSGASLILMYVLYNIYRTVSKDQQLPGIWIFHFTLMNKKPIGGRRYLCSLYLRGKKRRMSVARLIGILKDRQSWIPTLATYFVPIHSHLWLKRKFNLQQNIESVNRTFLYLYL